jgi:hypothetical protein
MKTLGLIGGTSWHSAGFPLIVSPWMSRFRCSTKLCYIRK